MDAASPLACLLIGQPMLRRMLRLGVLAALDQRIGLRYAMPAMTPAQTSDYITHHLKLAGRSDTLFSDDAMALDPRRRPRPAAGREQHRHPGTRRRDGRPQEHHRRAVHPHRSQRDHVRLTTTTPPRTPRPRRLTPSGPYSHPHMLTTNDADILILNDRAHPGVSHKRRIMRRAAGEGGPAGIASRTRLRTHIAKPSAFPAPPSTGTWLAITMCESPISDPHPDDPVAWARREAGSADCSG